MSELWGSTIGFVVKSCGDNSDLSVFVRGLSKILETDYY